MRKSIISMGATLSALFAAIICCARFITISLAFTPVPIVVQDMFAMLGGVLLGPLYGTISVGIFLLLCAVGVPVLSSGVVGLAAITASPTVGFILGYIVSAFVAGMATTVLFGVKKNASPKVELLFYAVAAVVASVVLFACGVVGFMIITGNSFAVTIAAVVVPFLPGNVVKIVIIAMLAKRFRPLIASYLKNGACVEKA